jgi:hypothetical protein
MQVRYVEDLASHDDPESCVGGREAGGEASTGKHAGGALSRENFPSGASMREPRTSTGWPLGLVRPRGPHRQIAVPTATTGEARFSHRRSHQRERAASREPISGLVSALPPYRPDLNPSSSCSPSSRRSRARQPLEPWTRCGIVVPLVLDGPITRSAFRAYVKQSWAPALTVRAA